MYKRGFTLVELLVVIAIIGLLASIISVSLSSSKAKSRDAKRVADIKNLQLSLSLYYNDNIAYPTTLGALVTGGYISALPRDPSSSVACTDGSQTSCYKYSGYRSGVGACNASNPVVSYQIGAVLEETANQSLVDDIDYDFSTFGSACTGGNPSGGFNGTSIDCSSTAGTAQPGGTEKCYSQKP